MTAPSKYDWSRPCAPGKAWSTTPRFARSTTPKRFSGATPGPLAATGLPRNRDELVEIVRQSIREELAGPLGERISSNIRALIEREVARALAERDGKDGP